MTGKFEVHKSANGEYFFRLKAANGEIILNSEQYNAKPSVQAGIESVKANAPDDTRFDRKMSGSAQHYYILKATNGEILGRSEMYSSAAAMEKGIEAIKANAPSAAVVDLTLLPQ